MVKNNVRDRRKRGGGGEGGEYSDRKKRIHCCMVTNMIAKSDTYNVDAAYVASKNQQG